MCKKDNHKTPKELLRQMQQTSTDHVVVIHLEELENKFEQASVSGLNLKEP